ncbi:Zinc metalloproteinase-disintegrin-like ohanin [Scenedesmus sp. PABB004]|nr:Zinc metalloproteinase-disintegrin-like ohanin [Scenedesmus sp. PABB004]
MCRNATGACDLPEFCTGSAASCPVDTFRANGTVCRNASGLCDAAEVCSGSSASCPADTYLANGTVCRAAAGLCDVAEVCDGTSSSCPADVLRSAGFVCRAAAGDCDVDETCNGTTALCGADLFKPNTTQCRAANGSIPAQFCTGDRALCPAGTLPTATVWVTIDGACSDITHTIILATTLSKLRSDAAAGLSDNIDGAKINCTQTSSRRLLAGGSDGGAARALLAVSATYGVRVFTVDAFTRTELEALTTQFAAFVNTVTTSGIGVAVPALQTAFGASIKGSSATLTNDPLPSESLSLSLVSTGVIISNAPYQIEAFYSRGPSIPITNAPVSLSTPSGTLCRPSSPSNTNANGKLLFNCNSDTKGDKAFSATANGLVAPLIVSVRNVQLTVRRQDGLSTPIDKGSTLTIEAVLAFDPPGPSVSGLRVTLTGPKPPPMSMNTDQTGVADFAVTFGDAGTTRLTATAFNGAASGFTDFTVTGPVVPPTPSPSPLPPAPSPSPTPPVTGAVTCGSCTLGNNVCSSSQCPCVASTTPGPQVCSCDASRGLVQRTWPNPAIPGNGLSRCTWDVRLPSGPLVATAGGNSRARTTNVNILAVLDVTLGGSSNQRLCPPRTGNWRSARARVISSARLDASPFACGAGPYATLQTTRWGAAGETCLGNTATALVALSTRIQWDRFGPGASERCFTLTINTSDGVTKAIPLKLTRSRRR